MKGDTVKEDLILRRSSAQSTYSYELKLNGLSLVEEADGTISFRDAAGHTQWTFAKPFMTDAAGKYSDKVTLNLRKAAGKVFVDVVADQAFLHDAGTQYPVTIDPTIDSWDIVRDTFVASAYPTSSYSSDPFMYTGATASMGTARSLVQFFLPSLPSDSKIVSASANAYQSKNDAATAAVDLHRVTTAVQH